MSNPLLQEGAISKTGYNTQRKVDRQEYTSNNKMGNLLWENWNYRVYYKPLNTIVSHGQYLDVSLNKSWIYQHQ